MHHSHCDHAWCWHTLENSPKRRTRNLREPPTTGTLADDLEFIKDLVREAAELARQCAASVRPQEKANLNNATDLDHDLEQMIRAWLARAFPDDRLTSEEYAAAGGSGPRAWSIDPIDGTGNLVHGLPRWAISIGLLDAGEPVRGVIAVSPWGKLYWGSKNGGAWRDGVRLCAEGRRYLPRSGQCLRRHQRLARG